MTTCSHAYANGTMNVRMPTRTAKNAGEPPQNSECAYGVGRKDPAYAATPSVTPAIASHAFNRDSRSGVLAWSRNRPMTAPAKTNPAHGKKQNAEKPPSGRTYASSASGNP